METTNTLKSLATRVKEFLKLGDDSKIDSFFTRQLKDLSRAIETHKRNIDNLTFNNEKTLSELRDRLDDTNIELDNAYISVSLEDISTNAKQEVFKEKYWNNIETLEVKIQAINHEIEETNKEYENVIKETKEQIEEAQYRIDKINGVK